MAESERKRRGVTGGLLLIMFGLFFLAANLGYLTPEVFERLVRFWPVLIILAGVSLLAGRGGSGVFASFFAVLLILAVAAAALRPVLPWLNYPERWETAGEPAGRLEEPRRREFDQARFKLSFGGGELKVGPVSDRALLYRLDWDSDRRYQALARTEWEGGRANVRLYQPGSGFPAGSLYAKWDLGLPSGVPLDLEVNAGGSRAELDLAELEARSLDVKMGAGDVTIRLGPYPGRHRVTVKAGATKVNLELPRAAGVRVRAKGLLDASALERAGLRRSGDAYENDRFGKAPAQYEIEVKAGAGQLSLVAY